MLCNLLPLSYEFCIYDTRDQEYFVTMGKNHYDDLIDRWRKEKGIFKLMYYSDISLFKLLTEKKYIEISKDNNILSKNEIKEFLFYLEMIDCGK